MYSQEFNKFWFVYEIKSSEKKIVAFVFTPTPDGSSIIMYEQNLEEKTKDIS